MEKQFPSTGPEATPPTPGGPTAQPAQPAVQAAPQALSSATGGPTPEDIAAAGSLRTVLHRLIKQLRRETRNEAQLSLTERSALSALYQHGELLPSDIARMEKVTTQSMSQVISHLFELNYIHKNASTDDKRKVLLSLTPAGKAYVDQLRLDKQEWLARALHEKATPEEKELLMEAIKVLTKLIDE